MEAIKIEVNGNIAQVIEKPLRITSGTVGLPVEFVFDSHWDNMTKVAVFNTGLVKKNMKIVDNSAVVPIEALAVPELNLYIGVYGVSEDGAVATPTVWASVGQIRHGAVPASSFGSDIGTAKKYYDLGEQAAEKADASAKKAESDAKSAADSAELAGKEAEYAITECTQLKNESFNAKYNAEDAAARAEESAERAEAAADRAGSSADAKPKDYKITATFDSPVDDPAGTGSIITNGYADTSAYDIATAIQGGATAILIDNDDIVYEYNGHRLEPNQSRAFFKAEVVTSNGITVYSVTIDNEGKASRVQNTFDYGDGSAGNAVTYTPQTLTEEQQSQARANIGAVGNDDITQTTGNSETAVMSQKAVTTELRKVVQEKEVASVNLFDKNSPANKNGYIFQGNYNYTELSGFTVSHPIEAKPGTYTFTIRKNMLGNNALFVPACDVAGNIIVKPVVATDNGDNTATISIDENWGSTHFIINIDNTIIDTVMVVKGDTMPGEYHPYGSEYEVALAEDVKIASNLVRSSPLYGKKLSLNGDSICYGAGSTGGYGKMIADTYNMTLQNIGVSGGTITAETYYSNGTTPRHWICRTIENMDTDADYIILEGGVNDSANAVTLGTITPKLNSALDDTTFYGAFESVLKQLLLRFPGKKIGYIAVHQMQANFSAANDENTSYYYAAKKCCAKWGVPFLDLNISCPPWGMISEANTEMLPLKQAYTHNGDGWHPNEDGYRTYYVPKIVKWLESL